MEITRLSMAKVLRKCLAHSGSAIVITHSRAPCFTVGVFFHLTSCSLKQQLAGDWFLPQKKTNTQARGWKTLTF